MRFGVLHSFPGLAGLVTIGVGIGAMIHLRQHWCEHPLPHGLNKPVLAMEVVHDSRDIKGVEGVGCNTCEACFRAADTNRAEMHWQQSIDRGFIVFYEFFFVLAAVTLFMRHYLAPSEGSPWDRPLAVVVFFSATIAAVFDWREDDAINAALALAELVKDSDAYPIRHAAYWKWRTLFWAVIAAAPVFWARKVDSVLLKWIGRACVFLALLAGVFGVFFACWFGIDTRLQASASVLFLLFPLATIYFLSYGGLHDGTQDAFDGLANRIPFNKLTNWPGRSSRATKAGDAC